MDYSVIDVAEKWFSIFGNLVTILVGVIGIVGFWLNRSKISVIFRYIQLSYVSERIKRINETLGKMESVNYDNKEDRREIFALMGQLLGQLKTLEELCPEAGVLRSEIESIVNRKSRLNEAIKRKILFSVHHAVDQSMKLSLNSFTGHDN